MKKTDPPPKKKNEEENISMYEQCPSLSGIRGGGVVVIKLPLFVNYASVEKMC